MRHNQRNDDAARVPKLGAIKADEIMPFSEAARRLGWGERARADAKRGGLRTVRFGRADYVRGADVLAFFAGLADAPQATTGADGVLG